MTDHRQYSEIILPEIHWQAIVEHCRRKLAEQYLPDEVRERKAYGLIAGRLDGNTLRIARCIPLLKNARFQEPFRRYMDRAMGEHAYPSETATAQRGWVADPEELVEIMKECRRDGLEISGSYHMHRVAWKHDPLRDTPTEVDTVLADGSGSFIFIVSMVDPARPTIRAFYEGEKNLETPIKIVGKAR